MKVTYEHSRYFILYYGWRFRRQFVRYRISGISGGSLMAQKIFQCDKCGAYNIYFENIDVCISCGEEVDFLECVFDDGEDTDFY